MLVHGADPGVDDAGLEEAYRQRSLLKRSVYPEDIAEAILFLISDKARFITGQNLGVDGGWWMH